MPQDLGTISEIRIGVSSLFQLVEGYKKIKKHLNTTIEELENIEAFYEQTKFTLSKLEKTPKDLGL